MSLPKPKKYRRRSNEAEKQAIAKRFRAYRAQVGINQTELAALMGLFDRSSVSDIERGHNLPHHSTLRRFTELERRVKNGLSSHKLD